MVNDKLYQLTRNEFCKVWTLTKVDKESGKEYERPMSMPTFYRRRSWAVKHYPRWRKVFLADGRVDLIEYQKFNTFYSDEYYKEHADPHLREVIK